MYKDWSCINSRQEVRYQQPLLYKLKMQLLDQESDVNMGQTPCTELPSDRDGLVAELESLKIQKYALQIETDIFTRAAEEPKKACASVTKN
jgi:hypothetical protein